MAAAPRMQPTPVLTSSKAATYLIAPPGGVSARQTPLQRRPADSDGALKVVVTIGYLQVALDEKEVDSVGQGGKQPARPAAGGDDARSGNGRAQHASAGRAAHGGPARARHAVPMRVVVLVYRSSGSSR
eukprot:404967-Prorocentrum_minimum.AAC.4